ncbi:MAG: hypothetical protein AB8B61_06230 [Cyclobacteriaceae bacterium]
MSITQKIKSETPKAWKYFVEFYRNEFEGKLEEVKFESLAFEYQLGVFIAFFNTNSTDVDIYSNELAAIEGAVEEAFNQYEEYLFLDS